MKVGVPKEIKNNEARVAMTPTGVESLVKMGHWLAVEKDAGLGSGFTDQQYEAAGASIVETADAWAVDLVVKVKEPQELEYDYLADQMIFTFFHLAGVAKSLTLKMLEKGTTAIAYEALEDAKGRLPILAPMSAVAGNMSVLMGAYYLASFNQGNGMQLGTILEKSYGKVVVIGDGVVGLHAAKVASAMGAEVIIAGLDKEKWIVKSKQLLPQVSFIESNKDNISKNIVDADLVIGAVLCRGARAPKLVTEKMLKTMRAETVVVDVSIDQGGCFETSRPTTHSEPVFIKHGVTHYCVANMPGAFPKASTIALTDVTISYIQDITENFLTEFMSDKGKVKAINVYKGKIVSEKVAQDLGLMACYQSISGLKN